jgi:hypothetical protein
MNTPHPNQLSTDTATSGAQGSGAFTPGPWSYDKCHCGHPGCDQHTVSVQGGVGFIEADARLIAAAPAMYEALKDLLSAVEAQAQHAARVNTHSDAHLWEPSELLMKPARDALAAVDGRA